MNVYFFSGIGVCKLSIYEFPLAQYNPYSLSDLPLNKIKSGQLSFGKLPSDKLLSKKKVSSLSLILENSSNIENPLNSKCNSKIYILFPFIYYYFAFYASFAIFFIFDSSRSLIYSSKIKSLNKQYSLIAIAIILLLLYFTTEVSSLMDNCNSKVLCISMESTEDILVNYLISLKIHNRFPKNVNIRKVNSFMKNNFESQLEILEINSIIRSIWEKKDWNRISDRIKKQHVHSQSRTKFQKIRGYLQEITKLDFIDQQDSSSQVYSNDFNFLTFFFYRFSKTVIFMVFISILTLIFYFYFRKSIVISMKILLIVLNIIFLILFFIFLSYYKMISRYQDSPNEFLEKLENLRPIFKDINNYRKIL